MDANARKAVFDAVGDLLWRLLRSTESPMRS